MLQPNDPDSYYQSRELVPNDMLPDLEKAKIVITNYHPFKLRERMELSKGGRSLLQGRGESLATLETEGQMLQRVMPELMGLKNLLVLNDEAHHCYREKPGEVEEEALKGDDRKEAEKNTEAARLWISGLETVGEKLGINRVFDLSATPFFLRGSGYAEGTLFPWTMCDFSLMDAIECGIVKLPRVPVADNIPGGDMPKFRKPVGAYPRGHAEEGAGQGQPPRSPEPAGRAADRAGGVVRSLPENLRDDAGGENFRAPLLHRRLQQHLDLQAGLRLHLRLPPRERERLGDVGERAPRAVPQLRRRRHPVPAAPHPPDRQRTARVRGGAGQETSATWPPTRSSAFAGRSSERTGDLRQAEKITDQNLLREVMNTVGKEGRLGDSIRCVVSVSMLTEGWGREHRQPRARGPRLRNPAALRTGRRPRPAAPILRPQRGRPVRRRVRRRPRDTVRLYRQTGRGPGEAAAGDRPGACRAPGKGRAGDSLPAGGRVPGGAAGRAARGGSSTTTRRSTSPPTWSAPRSTRNQGIIGEGIDLSLVHTNGLRTSTLLFHLTQRLLYTKYRDPGEEPKLHLFGQLKRITRQWLDGYLVCKGGTYPAQLMYQELADMACERIAAAITREGIDSRPVKAVLDPYNPVGSTAHVNFNTTKTSRYETDSRRCHVNWVVLDSDWEAEFCRVAESHPQVRAYVKNHNLGLEVPYRSGSETRTYLPDFIVLVDDGRGEEDLLHLIVEIKGYRREDAKDKKTAMDTYWVPGVNNHEDYGRWGFAEFTDVFEVESAFNEMIEPQAVGDASTNPGSKGFHEP